MNPDYTIARDGLTYGPYSDDELRGHLASGHVLATDLARTPAMREWLPLTDVLPSAFPKAAARQARFSNPPNLPWWMALALDIVTCTIFFVIWDIVQSAWMHGVRRSSRAIYYFVAAAVLFLISAPDNYHSIVHALFNGPAVEAPYAAILGITGFIVRFLARFSMRRSLLEHFNRTEPIGLHLSWFMTLLFGGLYFQYHINRINEIKRAVAQLQSTQR